MSRDDDTDLIETLLTRDGMIMEDSSIIALSSRNGELGSRIAELREAVNSMAALVAAAEVIR